MDDLDLEQGYAALRGSGAAVAVTRDVVWVSGPDAVTYLQGQLSQDVAALEIGATARSFVLQPQGKVDGWVQVLRCGDQHLALLADAGAGEGLLARLQRFKIRTDARLELQSLEGWVLASAATATDGDWTATAAISAPLDWPGTAGATVLGTDVPPERPVAPAAALEALRIEAGIPVVGTDVGTTTIPGELGEWVIDASVSFTKGCYTGQELVARIDSRGGNVPRPLRGIVIGGDTEPPVGAEVVAGGKPVGVLTSVARSPRLGVVALAPVARGIELPASVLVRWDGVEAEGEVAVLPLA